MDAFLSLEPIGKRLFLVASGGGIGAMSRYAVQVWLARSIGTGFPWGTLVVNFVGCFLAGLLFGLAERSRMLTPEMRLFLITGYIGSLTTFSAFALETVNAGRADMTLQPLINIMANTVGCLFLTYLGLRLGGLK